MIEGNFGLFSGENEQIYFNVRKGDNGIPLESILPEHMRGNGFADAPIPAYLNLLYMWLCSKERWQSAQTSIAPELRASNGLVCGGGKRPPGLGRSRSQLPGHCRDWLQCWAMSC